MGTGKTRQDHLIIVRNAIKCLACNKTIESKDRHDYRTCGCPNQAMVDGGHDYLRRGAVDLKLIEDWSEYTMPNCLCKHTWEDHHHGCVMNPKYFDHPLTFTGMIAQECEATQTNGDWHSDDESERCYCSTYHPDNLELIRAAFEYDEDLERQRRTSDGNAECEISGEANPDTNEDARETADDSRAIQRDERSTPQAYVPLEQWDGESQGD